MARNGKDKGADRYQRWQRVKRLIEVKRTGGLEELRREEMALARQLIDPERLLEERELEATRFIAYRYMTPFEATELFSAEFDKCWDEYRKLIGIRGGRPAMGSLLFQKDRVISALWRARQAADYLGMPYRLFIKSGMEYMLQESGKQRLAMPNQLCGPKQIERALNEWSDPVVRERAVGEYLRNPDPRFFVENFRNDPVQISALDVVERYVRDLGEQGYIASGLAKVIGRFMTEAEARRRFDADNVDEAMGRIARNGGIQPKPSVAADPYVPACFGYSNNQEALECVTCPVFDQCGAAIGDVRALLKERTGAEDPRGEKVRESNRRRQQTFRAKKRAEVEAAVVEKVPTPQQQTIADISEGGREWDAVEMEEPEHPSEMEAINS